MADDLLGQLAGDLADEVVQRYRIDRVGAVEMIVEEWRRQPKLMAELARATSADEVRRLRVFRDAASAAKKAIYHRLRRYRPVGDAFDEALRGLADLGPDAPPGLLAERVTAVAAAHVSTAERLPHLDTFLAGLAPHLADAKSIVDVGCGVLPLLFPLDTVDGYWALDRDRLAIAALDEYARIRGDGRLKPVEWNLADGWAALDVRADVALALKTVPVVARQSPDLLATLAAVPAERLVISGSRVAMAKRRDIERRETRELQRFCAEHGLTEVARFSTPDEICLVVDRSGR